MMPPGAYFGPARRSDQGRSRPGGRSGESAGQTLGAISGAQPSDPAAPGEVKGKNHGLYIYILACHEWQRNKKNVKESYIVSFLFWQTDSLNPLRLYLLVAFHYYSHYSSILYF